MAYVYQPFPKWLYRGGEAVLVADAGEELAHTREGWKDRPHQAVESSVVQEIVLTVPEVEPAPKRRGRLRKDGI